MERKQSNSTDDERQMSQYDACEDETKVETKLSGDIGKELDNKEEKTTPVYNEKPKIIPEIENVEKTNREDEERRMKHIARNHDDGEDKKQTESANTSTEGTETGQIEIDDKMEEKQTKNTMDEELTLGAVKTVSTSQSGQESSQTSVRQIGRGRAIRKATKSEPARARGRSRGRARPLQGTAPLVGAMANTASAVPQVNPVEQFCPDPNAVMMLKEQGFPEESILGALEASNNQVFLAHEFLMESFHVSELDAGSKDATIDEENEWECPECTFLNSAQRPGCEMCSTDKPDRAHKTKYRPVEDVKTPQNPEKSASEYTKKRQKAIMTSLSKEVQTLVYLGYTEGEALKALEHCKNDPGAAATLLGNYYAKKERQKQQQRQSIERPPKPKHFSMMLDRNSEADNLLIDKCLANLLQVGIPRHKAETAVQIFGNNFDNALDFCLGTYKDLKKTRLKSYMTTLEDDFRMSEPAILETRTSQPVSSKNVEQIAEVTPSGKKSELQNNSRNPNDSLASYRVTLLRENSEKLKQTLILSETVILDFLCGEGNVLSMEDKEIIERGDNDSQIEKLIDIMQTKTNADFEKLCQALKIAKRLNIVGNLLTHQIDVEAARQKLAHYYSTEFSDINLYSMDQDAHKVELNRVYVPVTWKRLKQDNLTSNTEEDYESYMDIFPKLKDSKKTRVIVDGPPGAGKTTFVKKLCQTWAEQITKATCTDAHDHISSYTIILAIILRLVEPGSSLKDILFNQMPFLETSEVCAVIRLIYQDPEKICIVMDGFDELRSNETDHVIKIIKAETVQSSLCVTTTRPHGVGRIKRFSTKAIQEQFRLLGFNKRQRRIYIEKFFKESPDEARRMLQVIESIPEFMDLAQIPIRLEMMCHVFGVQGNLGRNLVQLYDKFIQCLLSHFERKYQTHPVQNLMRKYHNLLMEIGQFANRWDDQGQMKIVFDYEDLQKYFKDPSLVIHFGWITKYHPSSTLKTSRWSFTHLSLHEYFIAFHLAHTETPNTTDFCKRCHTVRTLERHMNIIKFLCAMSPPIANEVLGFAIKKIKGEQQCKRLLDICMELIPEYDTKYQVDMPMPKTVKLGNTSTSQLMDNLVSVVKAEIEDNVGVAFSDVNTTQLNVVQYDPENLKLLLQADCKNENKNMDVLKVYDMAMLPFIPDIDYISEVSFLMQTEEDYTKAIKMLPGMLNLQKLDLQGVNFGQKDSRYEYLHTLSTRVPKRNIKELHLEFPSVTRFVPRFVEGMENLSFLKVADIAENLNQAEVIRMCEEVSKCPSVKEFYVCSLLFCEEYAFLTSKSTCKLTLLTMLHDSEKFRNFVERLSQLPKVPPIHAVFMHDITALAMSEKFTNDGRLIGELICWLHGLRSLSLQNCGIKRKTLKEILSVLETSEKPQLLQELYIGGNYDEKDYIGDLLARLLECFSDLETLQLSAHTGDLYDMKKQLKTETKLKKLYLQGLIMGTRGDNFYEIFQFMPNLEGLYIGIFVHDSETQSRRHKMEKLFDKSSTKDLSNLKVLFIMQTDLSEDGLPYLAELLPNLNKLEELHIPNCKCTNSDSLSTLMHNLPPSVTHLNIIGNKFVDLPFILNKENKRFQELEKLNIGKDLNDEDTTLFDEALGNVNVYYDQSEVLVKMNPVSLSSSLDIASGHITDIAGMKTKSPLYNLFNFETLLEQ